MPETEFDPAADEQSWGAKIEARLAEIEAHLNIGAAAPAADETAAPAADETAAPAADENAAADPTVPPAAPPNEEA